MTGIAAASTGLALIAWSGGALACALSAVGLTYRPNRFGTAHRALVLALMLTALWALTGALWGLESSGEAIAEAARNLGWLFALYRLFAVDGRHASMRPVRPLLAALAFAELVQATAVLLIAGTATHLAAGSLGLRSVAVFHLLVSTGGLVLVHNLYGGASSQARLLLRWPALALAVLWIYDLNLYTIGYLSGGTPDILGALRGAVGMAAAGLVALGTGAGSEALRFRPSRAVAFQSASLLLIGVYLIAMVAVAQSLAFAGGDFAQWTQLAFVAACSIGAMVVLPSPRIRGWLRVTLVKHLFQHRYDYRAEWLRFTRTIGQGERGEAPLEERAIRAVADIADSPAGMLFTPGDSGRLELAARWQWPTADVPAEAFDAVTARGFERSGYIADLDQWREGRRGRGFSFDPPAWLLADPRAWAIVPLLHFDRQVGIVVLARPAQPRRLDWEDFDLLRVAGRQLASYLAEHNGQQALAEAARFDDFNRRIAFVMHDIKNLASQLSLLARNAELHADNPAFRADMLVTLRNSADKLNAMLARLSRYGASAIEGLEPVRADHVAQAVVAQFALRHPVSLVESAPCEVAAQREPLEQVLLHLVQNAVDASPGGAPVFVRVSVDGLNGCIEVVDSGEGMSPEFVRSRLFKPFVSTKQGGFGIGAYEARELVRAMQGRLDVESREGLGSRFEVRLPLAEAAHLLKTFSDKDKKVA
ncbi:MAG: PEP-CTERM system histidine kinase PrsK [Novosphingobium sp.]|nr:PEP-CTERM system histidine kinase PrsK [Novosphingobium sp.]